MEFRIDLITPAKREYLSYNLAMEKLSERSSIWLPSAWLLYRQQEISQPE